MVCQMLRMNSFGMKAGIDDAMILAEQFLARVFRDRAELVVHVGDLSLRVGDGDDGVLVERRLHVVQFAQTPRGLFIGAFALGDVRANGDVLDRFSVVAEVRNDGGVHPVDTCRPWPCS